ncbi:galactose-3-O-sulfotransferase 2-like isoform X2 [Phyllobates terribilis]|uniref:galactose-3-O-sulfotransferase 2-like isoform X2 n=1 Tax=Phyllobates terribilis TaxID=111132 RepID=UPI003CCB6E3D
MEHGWKTRPSRISSRVRLWSRISSWSRAAAGEWSRRPATAAGDRGSRSSWSCDRSRFVCSNIRCLKISGVILLITIVLFLALQLMKNSESERYEIPFISNLLPFNNGDGFFYGLKRSDNNYVKEQDTASELLHYLQKEQLQGPRWKEVLNTLKARIRSKTVLTGDSAVRSEQDTKFCQPKNNIFFLKTHKTASSSIMNILFRYGEFHNLTFAFPQNAHYSFPSFFRASYVNGFSEKTKKIFNIMCHHMRFKFTEVEKVMPEDTFYFTILRNPVSRMESSFSYNRNNGPFKMAKSLEDFLHNATIYYKGSDGFGYLGKNWITFDLGFEPNDNSSEQSVLSWHAMDNIFDLVLITEYYDESLILLKDALCWSFYDVLSFPLNSRSNSTKKTLTLETQEKIKSWNNLDWDMYVYFNNSFWKRVQIFGMERMEHEVKELEKMRTLMFEKCLEDEVDPQNIRDKSLKPYQSGVAKILGYNLKIGLSEDDELLCKRFITPELQYNKILQDKQKNKLIPRIKTIEILGNPMKNVTKSTLKT